MSKTIPYAHSRELLQHNIAVYRLRLQDKNECICIRNAMTERLAELEACLNKMEGHAQ